MLAILCYEITSLSIYLGTLFDSCCDFVLQSTVANNTIDRQEMLSVGTTSDDR